MVSYEKQREKVSSHVAAEICCQVCPELRLGTQCGTRKHLTVSRSNQFGTMSGPAVRGLELEGGLSSLTLRLTKVKSLKTKKTKYSEEDH